MAFGVTPDGYVRKTFEDLLSDIEARARELFGAPNLDIRDPDGYLANTYLPIEEQLDDVHQLLEIIYNMLDPARSTRQSYGAVAELRGAPRKRPTVGTHEGVLMSFDDAVPGAVLRGAVRFQVEGQDENTWMNSESFTIGSAGGYVIPVESEFTGSDKILQDAATVEILEGPSQLTAITVQGDATPGTDLEDEVAWRLRADALITEQQSTVGAALDALSTVVGARVVETPGYIQAIVNDGGATPNNTIAQTILDNKSQGAVTLGSLSGTAEDEEGESVTINFDRVTTTTLYVAVVATGDFSETAMKAALVAKVPATSGKTLYWSQLHGAAANIDGVENIVSLYVGTSPAPTTSADLVADIDEAFSLVEGNISIA